jgi:hypothetical protein
MGWIVSRHSRFIHGEGYPAPIAWEAGWDAESVSTLWRRDSPLPLAEVELGFGILPTPYTAGWTTVWGLALPPTQMLHLFTFPLRRLPQCRLPCPRKIQITPACRLVFAATLSCVLEGPSANSHYRSTSSDLAVQTGQCDHLFPHSYSVARNPSPYGCNLFVQVFRVVFGSSSSLC